MEIYQKELLKQVVIPILESRSRETGDSFDQHIQSLTTLLEENETLKTERDRYRSENEGVKALKDIGIDMGLPLRETTIKFMEQAEEAEDKLKKLIKAVRLAYKCTPVLKVDQYKLNVSVDYDHGNPWRILREGLQEIGEDPCLDLDNPSQGETMGVIPPPTDLTH